MVTGVKAMSLYLKLFVGCALVLIFGTGRAAAIYVFTPSRVMVGNGTAVVLKCTFISTNVLNREAFVSWTFLAEGADDSGPVSVLYFSAGKAYPSFSSQFKGRVEWVGDLIKNDASVKLTEMQFGDSGTYACEVKNPPDVRVTPAHTRLRVVLKENFPQTLTLGSVLEVVISAIIGLIPGRTPRDPG